MSTEVGATYAVSAWVRSDTDPAAAVVEIYVAVEGPAAGDCFQLDDLCFIPR